MLIRIRLFSDIKKYLPEESVGDSAELDMETGASVGELKALLGIPEQKNCMVTVNDTNRKEDHILEENDTVKIFPAAMGG